MIYGLWFMVYGLWFMVEENLYQLHLTIHVSILFKIDNVNGLQRQWFTVTAEPVSSLYKHNQNMTLGYC